MAEPLAESLSARAAAGVDSRLAFLPSLPGYTPRPHDSKCVPSQPPRFSRCDDPRCRCERGWGRARRRVQQESEERGVVVEREADGGGDSEAHLAALPQARRT